MDSTAELPPNGSVETLIHDGVARVRFGHPKANALPLTVLNELAAAIDRVGQDATARVLVLESFGDKAFCAGASFEDLQAITTVEQSHAFFTGFATVLMSLRTCPLLSIARVQGKAVGGGVGLLAAADYVIAVDSASVRLSEFAFDFGPFTVAPAIERKIGAAHLAGLAMDTAWRDSAWCAMTGLFSKVCGSAAELDREVESLASTLAGRSLEASKQLKEMLWSGAAVWHPLLIERAAISGRLWLKKVAEKGPA